ncbi:hypothetical protein FPV67DRAFT_1356093, partial [Lyophyllum atratum]
LPGQALNDQFKNKIRTERDFLPEAATTSCDLALEVLTTNRQNIFCIYHTHKDKVTKRWNGMPDGRNSIEGVISQRSANQKKRDKGKEQDKHDTEEKCLSCGCREDDALLGFIIWKTWTVSEIIGRTMVTEGFSKEEILTPRDRLFIIQALRDKFGLNLKDFY